MVVAYNAAARAGDVATVRALTYYSPGEHAEFAEAQPTAVVCTVALGRALQSQFGPEAGSQFRLPTDAAIVSASQVGGGDRITLEAAGASPIKLVRVSGRWVIDFPNADRPDDARARQAAGALAEVSRQMAADVTAGKFATADEAMGVLRDRTAAAF